MGDDWNQRKITLLEQKDVIEPELLEQVAKVLKVPVEAIKNFNDEIAINIISNNTFENFENCAQPASIFNNSSINPVEKWIEALEDNKRLYEALLKSEREKFEIVQRILDKLDK